MICRTRVQTFAIVATTVSVFVHIFARMLVKPHLAAVSPRSIRPQLSVLAETKEEAAVAQPWSTLSSLSGNNNKMPAPVSQLSPAYSQIIISSLRSKRSVKVDSTSSSLTDPTYCLRFTRAWIKVFRARCVFNEISTPSLSNAPPSWHVCFNVARSRRACFLTPGGKWLLYQTLDSNIPVNSPISQPRAHTNPPSFTTQSGRNLLVDCECSQSVLWQVRTGVVVGVN